jgi:hypothetical protein
MPWLFAAVAGIGAVEVLLRLPLARTFDRVRRTVDKVLRVIRSERISDHWKERTVPVYAARLLGLTLLTALQLLAILLPMLVLAALAAAARIPFLEFALSMVGLVFTSAVAAAYAGVRTRVRRRV